MNRKSLAWVSLAIAAGVCVGSADCSKKEEKLTQLVVVVDTDLPTDQVDAINVAVDGPSGRALDSTAPLTGAAAAKLPLTVGLVPGSNASANVTVTVTGLKTTTSAVKRVVRTRFVEGDSRMVQVVLGCGCVGVACPDGQSCGPQGCASVDVPPTSLPGWPGQPPGHVATVQTDGGVCGADAGDAGDAAPPDPVVQISAGHFHMCARHASGNVSCWGSNKEGQIGDGTDPQVAPIRPMPAFVVGISDAVQLSAGEAHNCVLNKAGAILCWGANDEGMLGNGTTDPAKGPVQAVGVTQAAQAEAGDAFSCAVLKAGKVFCWGINNEGQLGDGKDAAAEPRSSVPVAVVGIDDAVQVAAGEAHACALKKTGAVVCWGANDKGQIGLGATDGAPPASSNVPVAVVGLPEIRSLDLGEKHSCAVTKTNALWCWGDDGSGQLGAGSDAGGSTATPAQVGGLSVVKEVSAGGNHTCARIESGKVLCWGDNGFGQIGKDPASVPKSAVPLDVGDVPDAQEIVAGNEHSCAHRTSGKVVCWGHNNLGQLGDNKAEETSAKPVEVMGH